MSASPNLVGECLRCSEPKTGQVMIASPNLIGRRLCCSGPVVGWYETVPIRIVCLWWWVSHQVMIVSPNDVLELSLRWWVSHHVLVGIELSSGRLSWSCDYVIGVDDYDWWLRCFMCFGLMNFVIIVDDSIAICWIVLVLWSWFMVGLFTCYV